MENGIVPNNENEATALQQRLDQLEKDVKAYAPVSGLNARENLALFEDRQRKFKQTLGKLFDGDTARVDEYLQHSDARTAQTRSRVMELAASEARHELINTQSELAKQSFAIHASNDTLASSSATQMAAQARIEWSAEFNAALADIDKKLAADIANAESSGEDDEKKKAAIAVLKATAIAEKVALSKRNSEKLAGFNAIETAENNRQAEALRVKATDGFKKAYEFFRANGKDHITAYQLASEQVRGNVVAYFKDRIARGGTESVPQIIEYIRNISLSEFNESKVLKDGDGNPILDEKGEKQYIGVGTYDPSRTAFCTEEDFTAINASVDAALTRASQKKRLADAVAQEKFKLRDAKIRMTADRLSRAEVVDGNSMEALLDECDAMLAEGFSDADKTSSYITNLIKSCEAKYKRVQKESMKLQSEEQFEEMYNAFSRDENNAAMFMYFLDKGNGTREIVAADSIDGQNRMKLLIRNGITRGILKGERWKERLERLEAGRANEDYLAMMSAIDGGLGIEVDVKGSDALREAHGDRYEEIGDASGSAAYKPFWTTDNTGGLVNGERNGRLMLQNPKMLMFTWTDADGYKIAFTGDEMNQLLKVGAQWQMRHANPSPTGGDNKELVTFMTRVMNNAAKQKIKSHWFSADERIGEFSDIELEGLKVINEEFGIETDPKKVYNNGVYTGHDMRFLESASYLGELPSMSLIRGLMEKKAQKAAKSETK